ncbi:MAG: flagellar biosynthesis protein FlhF [Sedimentisphaerales bacterium]|nr:flagellar biosynthesis protein FlhF [Sedimentisphaerales bacterium]
MMNLKTFRAATMAQALALVKKTFGADAVIVRTRSYKHGGLLGLGARTVVEVVARPAQKEVVPSHLAKAGNSLLHRAYVGAAAAGPAEARSGLQHRNGMGDVGISRNNSQRFDFGPASRGATADAFVMNEQMQTQMADLRGLVENLVREQRRLHVPDMPEQLFDVYLDLIQREVAEELARELITSTRETLNGDQMLSAHVVRRRVTDVLEKMLSTSGPISRNLNDKARVVALIGPTGVGKTTTVAKLAANFKLRQNARVGLITIDTYRIGAVDQLRMYAQILDVPLRVVLTPAELKDAVAEMRTTMDYVFIDTAGRSQRDKLKIKELKTFLDAASPDEVHLVLSGTAHHTHMLNAAEEFRKLGVDRLILTKLDEAVSFGVVLSVMKKIDAAISYVTTGQDVPDDIEVGTGRRLARLLLGLETVQDEPGVNHEQGILA